MPALENSGLAAASVGVRSCHTNDVRVWMRLGFERAATRFFKRRVTNDARSLRGYTLVELMVVVLLVGIIAAISFNVFRRKVTGSKRIEAMAMIQSIRAAQERYRAMHTVYLDVSQSRQFYPRDPTPAGVGNEKTSFYQRSATGSHPDNARWWELKPTDPGPVQFGYLVNAGLPGEAMTDPAVELDDLEWPENGEPWYVIQAVADADADGNFAFYIAASLTNEVASINDGE